MGSPRRGRGGSDDGTSPLTLGSGRMGSKDPVGTLVAWLYLDPR
jgi:hypothetical protein